MTDGAQPSWDTWTLPFDYERARARGFAGTEAEAYQHLAALLVDRDPEGAIFAPEWSLELDGENGRAWYDLGDLLVRRGLWERAIAAFEQSLRVGPDHWVTTLKLGKALQAVGRLPEAIEALSEAHALNPKSVSPLVHRAECRAALGETELAAADLRAALELEPAAKRLRERLEQLSGDVKPVGRATL